MLLEEPRAGVKHRAQGAEQRKRREEALLRQKARRADVLARSRTTEQAASPEPPSSAALQVESTDFEASDHPAAMADSMDVGATSNGPLAAPPSDLLMAAEWMVDMPPDLLRSWLVLRRPMGRRCLVTASGGTTRAQGRSGKPRSFPSALPNGSRATRCGGMAACELDCIWSEADQAYFVVDVLSWKDHRLTDCPAEFRMYWLATKLSEARASEPSSRNPCRFIALAPLECTPSNLQSVYGGPTPHAAPSDGLLFLHRDALYEPGPSPLLLAWADATCSERFYDYGSSEMAAAVHREPEKAQRWRTDELDAAITFADLLRSVELASGGSPELPPVTRMEEA
jgi:snurportin-1